MDIYEALYTTRAMRRVKPDAIPEDTQARILDAAIRAPSGGDSQGWRVMLVDDKAVIANLAPLYRECMEELFSAVYGARIEAAQAAPEEPGNANFLKMYRSAKHMGITSKGIHCCCARSSRATGAAARFSLPCGTPCWPHVRKAPAAQSPACSASGKPAPSGFSVFQTMRTGSSHASCQWAIRRVVGESRRADRRMKLPSAANGGHRLASRFRRRSGPHGIEPMRLRW